MPRTARKQTVKQPVAAAKAGVPGAKQAHQARPPARPNSKGDAKRLKKRPGTRTAGQRPQADQAPPNYEALFRQLVARANEGDQEALTRLRKLLDLNPLLWKRAGDLTAVAARAWVELVAGGDRLLVESVGRRLAALKAELAGLNPNPLEALVADQVGLTWLAARYSEIQAAAPAGAALVLAAFRLKRAESAQRRHLAALKTMATLRALLPAGAAPNPAVRLFDPEEKRA